MIEIQLTQGKVAIVDDCDAHLLDWKWHYAKSGDGYAGRTFYRSDGTQRKMFLHHAIIGFPLNGFQVDHINGNTLDNRRINLRIVTQRENNQNRKYHRGEEPKASRFIGVKFFQGKYKGKLYRPYWQARITVKGKEIHLGSFRDEQDAANAYKNALKNLEVLCH